jgi:hypothetical protein
MADHAGTWAGGQTYQNRAGRLIYVIARMHSGVRYAIKLDSTSERDALAELALFERDPAAYKAAHPSTRGVGAETARRVRQSAIDIEEARARALCIDNAHNAPIVRRPPSLVSGPEPRPPEQRPAASE